MSSNHLLSKDSCQHCGNNPVNHTASYINEFILAITAPFYQLMGMIPVGIANKIVSVMYWPFIRFFRVCGVWKYHRDMHKACSDRTQVIWKEATKRNIAMEGIVVFGKPIEQYRANIHGSWNYFESLPIPSRFHQERFAWIDDKNKFKKFMRQNSIPTAYGGLVTTYEQALQIFRTGKAPYIIKPRSGSRGRHTTTHIYTEEQLKEAFEIAKQLSYFLIMEEHLVGSVYRGTYVAGEIVGILRGDPPRVCGDGVSSISQLITIKNASRHPKVNEFVMTSHIEYFLHRQGYTPQSILPKELTIDLTEKVGISYGGHTVEMIDVTHPEILKILKDAGDAIGAAIVGFDFIIADVTKSPLPQRWGLIEANSLPFIELHHFPLEGTPVNVAAKVWDMWEK